MPSPPASERLSKLLGEFAPDWLFVPPVLDFHRDHIGTSLLAIQQWLARGCRERLFLYELWQPLPGNWLVDVTPVLALKRLAIAEYRLPMRYKDYSAAFEGLMRYRGLYLGPMLAHMRKPYWRSTRDPGERLLPASFGYARRRCPAAVQARLGR